MCLSPLVADVAPYNLVDAVGARACRSRNTKTGIEEIADEHA